MQIFYGRGSKREPWPLGEFGLNVTGDHTQLKS